MMGLWEHVHRLYCHHFILYIQELQVASLGSRVAADIDDALRLGIQDNIHHIGVHTCTGRVGDDDVGPAMLGNEIGCEDVFHIACIEQGVFNAIDLRIDLGILDGFRYILDANDLASLTRHEVGNSARTCVEVLYQFVACKSGTVTCLLI